MKVNPDAINYGAEKSGKIPVYIGRKRVGEIRVSSLGYRYHSKWSKTGGATFDSLAQCKRSLEEE